MSDDPTIEEIERELRRARADELRAQIAEREVTESNLPTRVDEPASPLPYLGATAISSVALVAGIVFAGLPAFVATQVALTFLAAAMIFKRADDIPTDHPNALLRWVGDRVDRLGDRFGVELYGLMGLTTFLRSEVQSLSSSTVSLAEILASPIAGLVQWFISEMIESIMNAIWAAMWWLPLFANLSWELGVAVIAAAWAVLWVLDLPERDEDHGTGKIARMDQEEAGGEMQAIADGGTPRGRPAQSMGSDAAGLDGTPRTGNP